jgi:hypothetical protein
MQQRTSRTAVLLLVMLPIDEKALLLQLYPADWHPQ